MNVFYDFSSASHSFTTYIISTIFHKFYGYYDNFLKICFFGNQAFFIHDSHFEEKYFLFRKFFSYRGVGGLAGRKIDILPIKENSRAFGHGSRLIKNSPLLFLSIFHEEPWAKSRRDGNSRFLPRNRNGQSLRIPPSFRQVLWPPLSPGLGVSPIHQS